VLTGPNPFAGHLFLNPERFLVESIRSPAAASIGKAENKLIRFRITKPSPDDFFHIGRIVPQPVKNDFLLTQTRLRFRQPAPAGRLQLLQPVKLRAGLPEECRRRQTHAHKEQEIAANDETAEIHRRGRARYWLRVIAD